MRSTSVQDGLQVVLILGCGVALAGAGRALSEPEPSGRSQSWGLEQLLGAGLSLLGLAIIALWLMTLTAALIAAVLHRAGRPGAACVAARFSPAVMRRVAAALIGVNLLAVPAVAQASPSDTDAVPSVSAAATPGPTSIPTSLPTPTGPEAEDSADDRADESADDSADGSTKHPLDAPPVSPYWSVATPPDADTPVDARHGGDRAADDGNTQVEEASKPPVTPGWTPTPIPVDGGLLVRQETRTTAERIDVVVAPGDSLWSIVAAQLGPLATAAEVAEAWPAWFDTNRSVIGEDPSLLIPGQVLEAPPG